MTEWAFFERNRECARKEKLYRPKELKIFRNAHGFWCSYRHAILRLLDCLGFCEQRRRADAPCRMSNQSERANTCSYRLPLLLKCSHFEHTIDGTCKYCSNYRNEHSPFGFSQIHFTEGFAHVLFFHFTNTFRAVFTPGIVGKLKVNSCRGKKRSAMLRCL